MTGREGGARTVLVLGATGYVGSRLVPALLAAGHEVVASSSRAPDPAAYEWGHAVEWRRCDATDPGQVARALEGVDALVLPRPLPRRAALRRPRPGGGPHGRGGASPPPAYAGSSTSPGWSRTRPAGRSRTTWPRGTRSRRLLADVGPLDPRPAGRGGDRRRVDVVRDRPAARDAAGGAAGAAVDAPPGAAGRRQRRRPGPGGGGRRRRADRQPRRRRARRPELSRAARHLQPLRRPGAAAGAGADRPEHRRRAGHGRALGRAAAHRAGAGAQPARRHGLPPRPDLGARRRRAAARRRGGDPAGARRRPGRRRSRRRPGDAGVDPTGCRWSSRCPRRPRCGAAGAARRTPAAGGAGRARRTLAEPTGRGPGS